MKAKTLQISLLIALVVVSSMTQAIAQGSRSEAPDVSDKNLMKKEQLEDFYRSELRKGTLSDERRADYETNLAELQSEIKSIRDTRIENATAKKDTDPSLLEAELLNQQFRELDKAIADSARPMVLANETKSFIFNAGVSFLSLRTYSAPFTVSAEKVLSEKLSVGAYLGHFLEKVIDSTNHEDSNYYFTSNKANYKHTYINLGVRASYHYFNPTFILPPSKFDPYVTAMLGYTIKTGTHPFLSNEEFLPYDAEGNEVPGGEGKSAFLNPEKKGINYGVLAGLRYMHDDHLGFYIEAGYSNTAFATAGVTIRFLDSKTSVSPDGRPMVDFKVQISSSERQKKLTSKSFKGMEGIEEIKGKKEYVYVLTGNSTSLEDAENLQVELSGGPFKRCFVIAIRDGAVIKLEKGKKLMGIVKEEPETEEDPFKDEKNKEGNDDEEDNKEDE